MKMPKEPRVVIEPSVQEKIDADPKLAEALAKFAADAKNVMLGVQGGIYKTFDEGMAALGYEPEPIDPDDPPSDMPEEAVQAIHDFMENGPEEE